MSKWTARLPEIRAAIDAGHTVDQIAADLGTSRPNVYKICHRNGIAVPRGQTYKANFDRMVQRLREAGYTVKEPKP